MDFTASMKAAYKDREELGIGVRSKILVDLCCGRLGWSMPFLLRGWRVVGVDLEGPATIPTHPANRFEWLQFNVLSIKSLTSASWRALYGTPDFILASPPCQQFSKFGLKCFYPDPEYPADGIQIFNHVRWLCESSGIPHIIENVRSAQQFVGPASSHCGPFYLWGNGIPSLLPAEIKKGSRLKTGGYRTQTNSTNAKEGAAKVATIPPELANCVADYAERILEQPNVSPKP